MNASLGLPPTAEHVLAEAVLASHFTLSSLPGSIEMIEIEGAEGWTSPNPHPILSLMRWTTRDQMTAEAALDQVLDRFHGQGRGFDWMTGPSCAQAGLLPILESKGFIRPSLQVAAMVKQIGLGDVMNVPDGIDIRKLEDRTDSRISGVMAEGFDIPAEVASIFHKAYLAPSELQHTDVYAATLDGGGTPIGVGYLSYIGDEPSVLMRVSCTLEASRGRGVYSALVARRIHDAARAGRTQAFVHAYSAESQRCLEKLGFTTAGSLLLHRWRP